MNTSIFPFQAPQRSPGDGGAMSILEFPSPAAPLLARLDREPTEAELFPHVGKEDVCIYCGRFQTDEQAEHRTADHIVADLLAIHRTNEGLKAAFGLDHPGYASDVYDLMWELDYSTRTAAAPALADMAVAR